MTKLAFVDFFARTASSGGETKMCEQSDSELGRGVEWELLGESAGHDDDDYD